MGSVLVYIDDNVQCSERFSVETAMREGEFYDRSRMPPA